MLDPIAWIEAHFELQQSNAAEFWYDRMASQSGCNLPVIYYPFDGRRAGDFADRGQILDFAAVAGDGRVLDFGPGDGWPSLPMAAHVAEVVGVDGSPRRVEVCRQNAERLGIANAHFVHVAPGDALPFADASFDGATAASSVEQTPDPRATLRELYRVLKPGARLRMHYESLNYYRGRAECELALGDAETGCSRLLIMDRRIDAEYVQQYGFLFDLSRAELQTLLAPVGEQLSCAALTPTVLATLRAHTLQSVTWKTQHPSCRIWLRWLLEAGFQAARPTHEGGLLARRLYARLPEAQRPSDLAAADGLLKPLVEVVVALEAPPISVPGEWEPWITATR